VKVDHISTDRSNKQLYRVIADEIKELKKKKAKAIRERQLAESYDQRLQDMEGYMKKTGYLKREFDDDLVRRLLQTVRVINESKIEIQFKSGIVMSQPIDFED
jgi:site-specific DNA recombinase